MSYLTKAIFFFILVVSDIYLFYIAIKGLKEEKISLFSPLTFITYEGDNAAYPAMTIIFIASILPLSIWSVVLDYLLNISTLPIMIFAGEFITLGAMIYFRFKQISRRKLARLDRINQAQKFPQNPR